jgi:decaprenylphospho-beta-D-ribofuranose 2-oxidase
VKSEPPGPHLLTGWGLTTPTAADVVAPASPDDLAKSLLDPPPRGMVPRGLGRSYGDAAQNAGGRVIDTTGATDGEAVVVGPIGPDGVLRLPAGASLDAVMRGVVPRGFFVPVTPGTRFVTVGGAVAADIHGKNHHVDGSFMNHVRAVRLALPSGDVVEVGPEPGQRPELFWATAGGMGLTGVVLDADVVLPPIETSAVAVDTDRARNLDEVMALMIEGDSAYHYSVAWIDLMATGPSMGRAVLTRGDFAPLDALPPRRRSDPLAFDPHGPVAAPPAPEGLLNRLSIRAFNELWFRMAPMRRRGELQSITRFFHPLDMVDRWNRLYGRSGLLQWQCLVPDGEEDALRRLVTQLSAAGHPSFLTVLKRFGSANPGPLSFPAPGWTITLDIPAGGRRAGDLAVLLDRLDRQVADVGGRIYLAKDSRLRRDLMPVMYPRLDEWRAVKAEVDPDGVLQSDLGRRLGLC